MSSGRLWASQFVFPKARYPSAHQGSAYGLLPTTCLQPFSHRRINPS